MAIVTKMATDLDVISTSVIRWAGRLIRHLASCTTCVSTTITSSTTVINFLSVSKERTPIFHFTGNTVRLQYNFGAEEKTPVLINAGIELYHERLRSERFTTAATRHQATAGTLYGQAEWHLVPKLSFVTGFRLDRHSSFGAHFSPRASVLYQLGRVRLRTSYAEGFRAPSIKEQFMDWDHFGMFFIKGSDHLRPEVSRMLSFSPEWQTSHLSLTGIASYNVISNQIGTLMTKSTNTYHYTKCERT